jgi:hypothetical protein
MISNKSKKRKQHQKELNSLRNRMGSNIVWFNSLSEKNQCDILFQWKKEKYHNKLTQPEKVIDKLFLPRNRKPLRYGYGNKRFKWVERINYPPNIKHFINSVKLRYKPNVVQLRESAIDLLLKNK